MSKINRTNNLVHLVGTIISPFKKNAGPKSRVLTAYIEVKSSDKMIHVIPLTFFLKKKKQGKNIFSYAKDLTGKQVVVEGFIQGKSYSYADQSKDYLNIVVNAIDVLSDDEVDETIAYGVLQDETEDLPF